MKNYLQLFILHGFSLLSQKIVTATLNPGYEFQQIMEYLEKGMEGLLR